MFNQSFASNDGNVFYDALHMFEASLRGNQAKLNHYLDGVPGCGARTEREIRAKFFESISIITEMIKAESNPQRLVNLMNALLWDYQAEDLQVLASAQVFRTLSGDIDYSYTKYNTLYNAWGMEERYYSIENRDSSATEMLEYSLSARLRQCFDYLSMKVFSVVYSEDEKIQTNVKLGNICSALMQRIQKIVFDKFERHLGMLQVDAIKASRERDEDIRFDNQAGESPDGTEAYMIDQCLEFGEDCINKAREQHEKELKTRTKFVERFIKQYENPDQTKIAFMDSSMMNDGM